MYRTKLFEDSFDLRLVSYTDDLQVSPSRPTMLRQTANDDRCKVDKLACLALGPNVEMSQCASGESDLYRAVQRIVALQNLRQNAAF